MSLSLYVGGTILSQSGFQSLHVINKDILAQNPIHIKTIFFTSFHKSFTKNEKTILHRFLTPHNIVLLYLYFHYLCQ